MTPELRRQLRQDGLVAIRNREGADHLNSYGFAPDVVVDVGVHKGTPHLYDAFAGTKFVLIDPRAEVEADLTAAPADYDFHACAAGPRTGKMDLLIPVTKHGTDGAMAGFREISGPMARRVQSVRTRTVEVRKLDDLMQAYPGRVGLKIDTEGFELDVLQGATETLARTDFAILELSLCQRFEGVAPPSRVIAALAEAGLEFRDVLSLPGDGRGGAAPRYVDALFARWPS